MDHERSLRKGQALGTAASRKDLKSENRKKSEKGSSSSDLKRCKGTGRSYNANPDNINLAGKTRNLGAYSGDSKKPRGALDEGNKGSSQTPTSSSITNKAQHQDSKVIGTRQSFNLGIPLGSEPSTYESFHKVSGELKKCNKNDNLWKNKSCGTLGSFNAIGGSKIDAKDAIINSGCGAGNTSGVEEVLREKIKNNWNDFQGYRCWGTEKSFNAEGPGKEININDAKLNTGAFAGIVTEQASTSRRS